MPTPVIIICTILSTALLLTSYTQRFSALRKKTLEFNPLSPFSWMISSVVIAIFLAASKNFALAGIVAFSLILQLILFVWSAKNLREKLRKSGKKSDWKLKPADFVCVFLSVVAILVFNFTKDANIAAAISFVGAIFGEIPQMRKNFHSPNTEKINIYIIVVIRYAITTGTLQTVNFAGLSQTIFWAMFEAAEILWILYCQKRYRNLAREYAVEMAIANHREK